MQIKTDLIKSIYKLQQYRTFKRIIRIKITNPQKPIQLKSGVPEMDMSNSSKSLVNSGGNWFEMTHAQKFLMI